MRLKKYKLYWCPLKFFSLYHYCPLKIVDSSDNKYLPKDKNLTLKFHFLFATYFCRGELGASGIVLSRYPSSTKELINLSLFLVWFVTPRRTAEAWKSSSLPNTSRMMTTLILTSTLREMNKYKEGAWVGILLVLFFACLKISECQS